MKTSLFSLLVLFSTSVFAMQGSDFLPGTYFSLTGCSILKVEKDTAHPNRYLASLGHKQNICGPLKTIPSEYLMTVQSAHALDASGTLRLVYSGANVLILGEQARFRSFTTKKETRITVRYHDELGLSHLVDFTDRPNFDEVAD